VVDAPREAKKNPSRQCLQKLQPKASAMSILRDFPSLRRSCLVFLVAAIGLVATLSIAADEAGETAAESRLARLAQQLSADELGGRGLGERGLEMAAEAIAAQFRSIGLKSDVIAGEPFQPFTVTTSSEIGTRNSLAFARTAASDDASGRHLELGADYNPLAIGGSGEFELPLVFVGYGITADEAGYDDYAGIDVSGKAVVILRHEPQQENPHSAFAGAENSDHATFRRKVSNAYQHGAAAVVFVTDEVEIKQRTEQVERSWRAAVEEIASLHAQMKESPDLASEQQAEIREKVSSAARRIVELSERREAELDPVLGFDRAGAGMDSRDMPVLHVRRGAVDEILSQSGSPSLSTLESQIDEGPAPHSFALDGWRLVGRTDIKRQEATVRNVIGILDGSGPHADEAVVIGAHYDHLGHGGEGSAAPGSREIHNGADDNASGAAALVEIARSLAARKGELDRTVVFIAFTGEERGLLGSAHYVQNPVVPLEKTVAMLNLDMVGRLEDNKLIVSGTGTAAEFDAWVDKLNEMHAFDISKSEGGFGPSDHTSFYAEKIPVLHFFSGLHADYHKPSDDFEHLNVEGMRRIAQFVSEMAWQIATAENRPAYVAVGREQVAAGPAGDRPYFGSIPQFPDPGDGYALSGVAPESPAARGGLQAGDKIVRLGDYKVGNLEDFDGALRKYNAGDRVEVEILRGGNTLTAEVTLDPPK
jgi:hypothetical protein